MPYKRNYRRSYRSYPKRRIARTKALVTGQTQPTMLEKIAGGLGAAANVARAVMPIVSAINTEQKFIDAYATGQSISTTASIQPLSYTAQGTDEQNRIGNSILAKDLNLKLTLTPNYIAADYNRMRLIVFVDKSQRGTLPTLSELLQNTSYPLDSSFNKNYTDRFVIIKDKRFQLIKYGITPLELKLYKKLNFHVRYIGTTLATASAGENNIYFVVLGDTAANLPTYSFFARLNFTDN